MSHFNIEEAGGKRKCHMCGAVIKVGEKCLTFRQGGGQYAIQKNACHVCVEKLYDGLGKPAVVVTEPKCLKSGSGQHLYDEESHCALCGKDGWELEPHEIK